MPTSKEPELDLWQEAYNAVEEGTQNWIRENIGEQPESTNPFPELVALVRSSEEKHGQDAWQFELRGRAVLLRDYTSRVISCLSIIGDVAINFAPAPSPVIWNALKVVLKANVSQVEDRASIMGCTNLVLCLVRRGIVYQEVYLGGPSSSTSQDDLKETLIGVYKTCLEFLAFMHAQLRQGNMHRFLHELMEPGQGEKRVSEMKSLEQQLDVASRACEVVANRDRSNKHNELLMSLQLPLRRIDDTVINVLTRLEERKMKEVMTYLSTIPVGSHHNEKCNSRTQGTCEWLVEHPKFREWEDSSCSSIFWLQGNMGTGKSYLSSKVIDRYLVREEDCGDFTTRHDEGFAFFYCYGSDPSRQSTKSILRSYMRQLSSVPRRPDHIHQALVDLYKSGENIQHDLTLLECEDTLMEIINSYPRVTLVLDALDECTTETRRELARLFQSFIKESNGLLKVFIASRKERDIEKYFQPYQGQQLLVSISTSDNAGDIEKFITHQIHVYSDEWESIEEDTKLLVKKTLVEKSDGMFRWAYLQWQYLKGCRMNGAIRERLKKMPKTLAAAYDEIYNRFEPDSVERLMMQRAVRWVLYAKSSFHTITLLAAIETESERMDMHEGKSKAFGKSDLTRLTLESVCRDLVVRNAFLDTWEFTHASVAEYFLLKREPWIENAQSEITVSLIHFLMNCCAAYPSIWPSSTAQNTWRQTSVDSLDVYIWFHTTTDGNFEHPSDPRHPLQMYTQRAWLEHIDDTYDNDPKFADVVQALKKFLGEGGPRISSTEYKVFCKYIMPGQDTTPYHNAIPFIEPVENSRFGIIALGLYRLLPGWWDQNLFPLELNNKGQDLLALAAQFEHQSIYEDLIRRGFKINRDVDDASKSALGRAIATKNADVARFLLDNGARTDIMIKKQNLICFAASRGPEHLQMVLNVGANPNLHCGGGCRWGSALSMFGNMLELAVFRDLPKSARLLVEYGADVNAPLRFQGYDTILEYAVVKGDVDFARLLITHGADVHSRLKIGKHGSLLAAATVEPDSSLDMVKLLIEEAHSGDKAPLWSSLDHAMRGQYLTDMHQVDNQVLLDMEAYYG
ncbi:uncharacterized protein B0J16DRAFT_403447 [Fusarium flagelliforme]|uniref:uncharacterized protein n=1 Tax=Fusarium flagelliforme TaxID=2675880 RepID=UPI001E8CFDDA|nr:uncharacterized protein B0J16DRAFT_403447 [Fusarium flagelliforme]KAH7180020.1 hypothetical protein B0J16DRAFT_403447 [Fusarium flagelliforme]